MAETEVELIHRAFREVQMAEAEALDAKSRIYVAEQVAWLNSRTPEQLAAMHEERQAQLRARRTEILRRQRAELSATIRASFHLVQAQEILASIADGSFHD